MRWSENPQNYRQMVLVRRRVFVSAYLSNGGNAVQAIAEAGYPSKDKRLMKERATKLFQNPLVQKMMRAMQVGRSGVEQDRIHEEIKLLVAEAKARYADAREKQLDADPEIALKQEDLVTNRFKLLLQATELMLESCTKHLKWRQKAGDEPSSDKTLSLVQQVVIVDRASEEAKKTHEGAHEALDITPSRVVNG